MIFKDNKAKAGFCGNHLWESGNTVERVKQCTKEQVTLIGFGDIAQDKAFVYSIPIPIEFHEKRLKRKLTVTLAYLSPIHPSSIK